MWEKISHKYEVVLYEHLILDDNYSAVQDFAEIQQKVNHYKKVIDQSELSAIITVTSVKQVTGQRYYIRAQSEDQAELAMLKILIR
jgi:hypothetical protein